MPPDEFELQAFRYVLAGLFGVGFLALIVGTIIFNRREKKRAEALMNFALTHGLQYLGIERFGEVLFSEPKHSFLERFLGFHPFGRGDSQRAENLMAGTLHGLDFYAFDYHFSQGEGKSRRRNHYAIVAARLPMALPGLSLTPENLFTRVGQHLGMQEVKFELDAFNQRYFVRADDERRVFDLFDPRMIDYFMGLPPRSWQFAGIHVLVHKVGALDAAFAYQVMEEILGFHSRVPDMVGRDHGFTPQWKSALD